MLDERRERDSDSHSSLKLKLKLKLKLRLNLKLKLKLSLAWTPSEIAVLLFCSDDRSSFDHFEFRICAGV